MATSGSFNFRDSNISGLLFTLHWTVKSQDGLTSTISFGITADIPSSYYKISLRTYKVYADETLAMTFGNIPNWVTAPTTDRVHFGYGTFTVERDFATNQATPTIRIEASGNGSHTDAIGGTYSGDTHTYSDTTNSYHSITVDTTTVAGSGAVITAVSDFTDETNPTITYSYDRGSSVESVTLEACISLTGAEDDIPYREVPVTENTYTFELTSTERSKLWVLLDKGTTGTVRFYIKTIEVVNGERLEIYNYFTKTFNFVNYTPTISFSAQDWDTDVVNLTGRDTTLVRYMSDPLCTIYAVARKGATIVSKTVRNGDQSITLEGTDNTYQFNNIESNTFYVSATDSRGHTTNYAAVYNNLQNRKWVDYVKITCSIKPETISGEGVLKVNVSGKYFDGNFNLTSNSMRNHMIVEYKIRPTDETEGEWVYVSPYNAGAIYITTDDDNNYTYSFDISNLDYLKTYVLQVRVSDRLMTGVSSSDVVVAAVPTFDWSKTDFNFNVPVSMSGGFTYPQWLLWGNEDGTTYSQLGADDRITLDKPISSMPNGAVFVFSLYRDDAVEDASIHSFYVSKTEVALLSSKPHLFMMGINSNLSVFGSKYVYISDDVISGFSGNTASGNAACGITFDNTKFVLRYVIGV